MTDETPDSIAAAAARYKRDSDRAKKSRGELTDLVLDALRQPGAEPVDIARRADWTPAYVRKLAREKGIVADPAYQARTQKARERLLAEAAASLSAPQPAVVSAKRDDHAEPKAVPAVSPQVAVLPYERVRDLAARAEERHPEWVEEIRAEYPHLHARDLDYLIVDAGIRQGFKIPGVADRPVTEEEAAGFAESARSRADGQQRAKLEQLAGSTADGAKDYAVMHAGLEMGLLTHDEVYAEPDRPGEEPTP
ncbi:hypothetical protein ABZX40_13500 [Streptomyces sp. NPDC004610]|uniref:hypothetical protein n=1 Tax=unclassified Streptomyces TaxID=2593676 RepID=UPI0033BE3A81